MPNVQEMIAFLKSNGDLANAVAALMGAAAAILALIVSAVSLFVSIVALSQQRRHNRLSVTPMPEIVVVDYEDKIFVKLRNNGSGPMIVHSVVGTVGNSVYPSLIEAMPELPAGRAWSHFSAAIVDRSLLQGGEICLLELVELDGEKGFSKCLAAVREALAPMTVTVRYTNIYKSSFAPYVKGLAWFGRHADKTLPSTV